jgi:hypothetical protein
LQVQVFNNLLCAIRGQTYRIADVEQLERLVELGDYYRALPVLSHPSYAAILNSYSFLDLIPDNAVKLLPIAAKLRNVPLFKDCLIHLTGPWTKPRHLELTDPKLQRAARRVYNGVCATVIKAQENLLLAASTEPLGRDKACKSIGENIISRAIFGGMHANEDDRLNLPFYYRQLCNYNVTSRRSLETFTRVLAPLFKKNLLLDWSGVAAGHGNYSQHFLCAEIDDEDLPWDINQKYW